MATVQSLGLHEPSALPYLIEEGILPTEPSKDTYRWHQYLTPVQGRSDLVQEEILIAGSSVVWSRAGSVRRVLNLEIEDEPILQVFTTTFIRDIDAESGKHGSTLPPLHEKAIVVILRSQAHVLLLSGDSHIVPLSFEVGSAFPCPNGFILQRKIGSHGPPEDDTSLSFHHDLSTINESQGTIRTSARPSLILPEPQPAASSKSARSAMPRTFSCLQTMSELGLVVQGSSSKVQSLDECKALSPDEEIIYISRHDELYSNNINHESLALALTRSTDGKVTIWNVARTAPIPIKHDRRSQKLPRKSESSRRKSSNIYARTEGAVAPPPSTGPNLRESFGGLAQSYAENLPSSASERKSFAPEDIATQLGPEFEDIGMQTRASRRVSSMLARTDLGAGNDRGAFHDLAMGHGNRKSLNRAGLRGESIGSFGDRQSFGRRRSSFPATSILSNGTSFLNVPGQGRFDELDQSLEDLGLDDTGSDLSRDIGFFKITSFNLTDTASGDASSPLPKVMTILGPPKADAGLDDVRHLSVCVLDDTARQVAIVNLQVTLSMSAVSKPEEPAQYRIKATNVRRGADIFAATLFQDQFVKRLMILNKTRQGQSVVHLEAPWSPPFRVDLPASYALSNPFTALAISPGRRRDRGIHRTLPALQVDIVGLQGTGDHGEVVVQAADGQDHSLLLQLAPRDHFVRAILLMCNLVFGTDLRDSQLILFWEVSRWIRSRIPEEVPEWTALTVAIFALAVPFIDEQQAKKSTPSKRRRGGLMRSSSGAAVDLSDFNTMTETQSGCSQSSQSSAWAWLAEQGPGVPTSLSLPKSPRGHKKQSSLDMSAGNKNSFILQCIEWAREFIQSPPGEAATGPEGYLPISVNKDRDVRNTTLAKILVGMHLLYEEQKVNISKIPAETRPAAPVLAVMAQLGLWLGWHGWTMLEGGVYLAEVGDGEQWSFEETRIRNLDIPDQPFPPPSILGYLTECIVEKPDQSFPTLHLLADSGVDTKIGTSYDRIVRQLTPRTIMTTSLMEVTGGPNPIQEKMLEVGLRREGLGSIPDGLASTLLQALACAKLEQRRPGRPEAEIGTKASSNGKLHRHPLHTTLKDYHGICAGAVEGESLQRWDASSEADRHTITRLVFNEDRRFQEASKLVNQTRPPVVECTPQPEWNEVELLEAQKELAQFVTRRTLSVASGRGMMHFNARVPLLTERLLIPAFSLQCVMRPRHVTESTQAMTFSADKASFTEDKVCWAFFHNGTSAGLMISKDAKGIDTSWILYNKPPELTNRHAGFLLALGLNGHLRSLAKWVAFKYLTPKHTMTSIGLLLGLSVSYIGTQDQQITRLLSVHVSRLLPPASAELNLSPLTQTTGIVGIGLLYHGSQHRRMTDVMLSEIENNDAEEGTAEDSILRDEGYRLAAGFSLGLMNLGQGKNLHGLHEIGLTERLLSIAVGTKNVNLVHVLDRATAGAVMAIMLVFLKTNDASVARKVDIPDTIHQFDYVRPDIFLLRTLARHLVMWDSITPTVSFITKSLPPAYRHRVSLSQTKHLSTEDMPFFNIIAGICFAIGLRHAGTQCLPARDLLVVYLDEFLRLIRIAAPNYDSRVTLNSVRNCLDILALSAAIVMAGSGDIVVMRRLRSLHGRTDRDTPFGSHMAGHMALGTLFLGGGTMTLGTSNLAVAALCMSLYPVWPSDVLDNRGHLQALRHLWVLAVEGRCLVTRDEAGAVVGGVEGFVLLKNGDEEIIRAPGLLPDFDVIDTITVKGEGWWDVSLSLSDTATLEKVKEEGTVNVELRPRAAYDRAEDGEPLVERLAELEDERQAQQGGVPSINPNVAARTHAGPAAVVGGKEGDPFEWIFNLGSFKDYDFAERDLILNPSTSLGRKMLEETVVDYRLMFERGLLPETKNSRAERDKLWQVRMLLEWSERMGREDREMDEVGAEGARWRDGRWLKREVVERLRERIWEMSREVNDE